MQIRLLAGNQLINLGLPMANPFRGIGHEAAHLQEPPFEFLEPSQKSRHNDALRVRPCVGREQFLGDIESQFWRQVCERDA